MPHHFSCLNHAYHLNHDVAWLMSRTFRRWPISSAVKPFTLFKQSTIIDFELLNPLSLELSIKCLRVLYVQFFVLTWLLKFDKHSFQDEVESTPCFIP